MKLVLVCILAISLMEQRCLAYLPTGFNPNNFGLTPGVQDPTLENPDAAPTGEVLDGGLQHTINVEGQGGAGAAWQIQNFPQPTSSSVSGDPHVKTTIRTSDDSTDHSVCTMFDGEINHYYNFYSNEDFDLKVIGKVVQSKAHPKNTYIGDIHFQFGEASFDCTSSSCKVYTSSQETSPVAEISYDGPVENAEHMTSTGVLRYVDNRGEDGTGLKLNVTFEYTPHMKIAFELVHVMEVKDDATPHFNFNILRMDDSDLEVRATPGGVLGYMISLNKHYHLDKESGDFVIELPDGGEKRHPYHERQINHRKQTCVAIDKIYRDHEHDFEA